MGNTPPLKIPGGDFPYTPLKNFSCACMQKSAQDWYYLSDVCITSTLKAMVAHLLTQQVVAFSWADEFLSTGRQNTNTSMVKKVYKVSTI